MKVKKTNEIECKLLIATMENSMEAPQTTKNRTTI